MRAFRYYALFLLPAFAGLLIAASPTLVPGTGWSDHVAPGGKKVLNVTITVNLESGPKTVNVTPSGGVLTNYPLWLEAGEVPPGKVRWHPSTKKFEFGTTPGADDVVDIEWEWAPGAEPPTIGEATPAWTTT